MNCEKERFSASAVLSASGRTELLRTIYGLDPAQSGEVRVAGRRLPPARPDLAIRAGLGFAPEERKSEGLWLDWSLIRNTTIADLRHSVVAHLLTEPVSAGRPAATYGR